MYNNYLLLYLNVGELREGLRKLLMVLEKSQHFCQCKWEPCLYHLALLTSLLVSYIWYNSRLWQVIWTFFSFLFNRSVAIFILYCLSAFRKCDTKTWQKYHGIKFYCLPV